MTTSFEELIEQHGSAPAIPHRVLYDWMVAENTKEDLRNRAKIIGRDEYRKLPSVAEIRRRSKTDLFWLSGFFLWPSMSEGVGKPLEANRINLATHGPIFETFVHKDPSKPIADQDTVFKERLILYPRGGLKSTIDVCDAVQWILCFPEIRILYLTATDDLSEGFVNETKGHFVIRAGDPTPMNFFFPEYCVDERVAKVGDDFTCPLYPREQTKRKEPTVMAKSIRSTMSGWHFELLKIDDMVDTINAGTEEGCKKVTKNYGINKNMLMPFGYADMIGTRYAVEDHYGIELEKNVGELKAVNGMDNPDPRPWTLTKNISTGKIILIGKGWEPTKEAQERLQKNEVREEELKEKDWILLFPEHMTYAYLRKKQRDDEPAFEGQIQQNPRPKSRITFDKPTLLKHTVPFTQVPVAGPIISLWDFAFSTKKGRDYSTCATSIYNDKGQLFVIDLIRARFNHTALAKSVVDNAERYRPTILAIEDASGSNLLEPTIIAEAEKRGKPWLVNLVRGIDWFTPDQNKDAKKTRMASMHPWLSNDRLFFVAHLPHLQALYDEFEICLIAHHHDDIPDVISQQLRYVPKVHLMVLKKELPTWSREDAAWNLIFEENCDAFGRIGFGGPPPVPVTAPPDLGLRADTPSGDLEPMLGAGLFG